MRSASLLRRNGQGRRAYGRGIVAQLDVQAALPWARDTQRVVEETRGHRGGVRELRIRRDRVHQVQVAATQLTWFVGTRGAANLLQHRKTDEYGQRLPVAFTAL